MAPALAANANELAVTTSTARTTVHFRATIVLVMCFETSVRPPPIQCVVLAGGVDTGERVVGLLLVEKVLPAKIRSSCTSEVSSQLLLRSMVMWTQSMARRAPAAAAVLVVLCWTCDLVEALVYNTTLGPVTTTVLDDRGVKSFRSIPFAAPPVDALRWQPPESREPWSDVLDVSAIAPICKQASASFPSDAPDHSADSEDCLYLCLYTTSDPPSPDQLNATTPLKPVMLWVHGGGLVIGDAYLRGSYDGAALAAAADVVVVSVQYRLGALGFLSHEGLAYGDSGDALGNFGALDQRAAMRWVHDNAKSFGGDPDRVMIFGESAGGESMCFHLTSPASEGLFAALAVQSGSCDLAELSREAAAADGRSFAEIVGCGSDDDDVAAEAACLRSLPSDALTFPNASSVAPWKGAGLWTNPEYPWGFTVDGTEEGLPDFSTALLAEGKFNRHGATVLGSNTNEFQCLCALTKGSYNGSACLFAEWLPATVPALQGHGVETEEDMEAVMAHALGVDSLPPDAWASALALYPASAASAAAGWGGGREVEGYGPGAVDRVSAMLVDSAWIGHCGTKRVADFLVGHNHSAVWLYHFAVEQQSKKTPHFSEVPYVFGHCGAESSFPPCAAPEPAASAVSDFMVTAWSRLAWEGENGTSAEWPRYDPAADAQMLRIDFEMSLESDYRAEYCSFWENLQLQLDKR